MLWRPPDDGDLLPLDYAPPPQEHTGGVVAFGWGRCRRPEHCADAATALESHVPATTDIGFLAGSCGDVEEPGAYDDPAVDGSVNFFPTLVLAAQAHTGVLGYGILDTIAGGLHPDDLEAWCSSAKIMRYLDLRAYLHARDHAGDVDSGASSGEECAYETVD